MLTLFTMKLSLRPECTTLFVSHYAFIIKWFLYCFEDICSSDAQTADEVAEDKPADSFGSLIMIPSRDFSSMNERLCSLTRSLTD